MQEANKQLPPELQAVVESAPFIACKSCNGIYFEIAHSIKMVSLTVVGRVGQYMPVQYPNYRCSDCGEVLEINVNDYGKEEKG